MISFIRKRIIRNLEAIQGLLLLSEYEDICAGLYTFAVEEYGKILFLMAISPEDNKIKFRDTHDCEGFRDHYHKFELALEALPDSCKKLRKGSFTRSFSKSFTRDIIPDFKARMALFYADFEDKHSILEPPKVDRSLLEEAVKEFLNFMRKQKFP
jgi:AbiV family abortive infection protein